MFKRLLPLLLLILSGWTAAEPLRTGLVLSGGGARGLAHIGVLKQLEEVYNMAFVSSSDIPMI